MNARKSQKAKRTTMRWTIVATIFTVFCIALLIVSGTTLAQQKKAISIGTGGTGGVYYPYGGGIASVITKYIPGVEATAEVTAASGDNCMLLGEGRVQLGFMGTDIAWDAYQGKLKGYNKKIPLRTIAELYPQVTSLIVLDGSGINKMEDLKGKKVSTGAPNSGTEFKVMRILKAYGLNPDKDIKRQRLSFTESAGALKDRKLDAIFVDGGVPMAAVLDLAATPGMKIRFINHGDAVAKLNAEYGPIYFEYKIPKRTYPGIEYESTGVANANGLATTDKMDEELVYKITKALFEHKADLVRVHKEADQLSLNMAVTGSPIPFHKGAARYYNEKKIKVKTE
jgi:TRAP transporter TAXI family solute receptor